MKDLIIEIEDVLKYNKYSLREVADMFGVELEFVMEIDGGLEEEV